MKLQSFGIIFIVIVFPMILVLSYYLSLQIETITLQNDYNSKLIDATNDALTAFELNTANEDLSNVSDSLRSIVDASTNIFMNTLATSLRMSNASNEMIETYVPAILYTMYDGYYIHTPTQKPEIKEKTYTNNITGIVISEGAAIVGEEVGFDDGGPRPGEVVMGPQLLYSEDGTADADVRGDANDYGSLLYAKDNNDDDVIDEYTTNINEANVLNTDYVLKSYMPYSATYVHGANSVTINYTLDNFINVSGMVNGIYYTKSGYYINANTVNDCPSISNWRNKGQDELKEICMSGQQDITITFNAVNGVTPGSITFNRESDGGTGFLTVEQIEQRVESLKNNDAEIVTYQNLKFKLDNIKAITYYLTNTVFSEWVNGNLGFVNGDNLEGMIDFNALLTDPDAVEEFGYSIENINQMFYNFEGDTNSIFSSAIDPEDDSSIFNSHKYNIIKNSIQYNLNLAISSYSEMFSGLTFEMPMLTDLEWGRITENVSVASFLQGLNCGLKTYSGYAVITSTNNELTVIPEEIYYVYINEFNQINDFYYHRLDCPELVGGDYFSFKSKEVKYDEIYKGDAGALEYEYDHKNLACYDCIIQNNYHNYNDGIYDKKITLRAYLGLEDYVDDDGNFLGTGTPDLLKAYYIAVGKERQNLYKTTAYSKNEGVEVITPGTRDILISGTRRKAEVTIEVTKIGTTPVISIGGKYISTGTKSIQTVIFENDTTIPSNPLANGAEIEVRSIKYIYK